MAEQKLLSHKDLVSVDALSLVKLSDLAQLPSSYNIAGIYFLFDSVGALLYIGMSQNLLQRIAVHRTAKRYATFAYFEVFAGQRVGTFLHYLEAYFIQKYVPLQNESKTLHNPDVLAESAFSDAILTVLAQREFLRTRPQYRNKNNWID
jgi:hypothetical protein